MPTSDNRRAQTGPHLKVSIEYAKRVFAYLYEHKIRLFRLPSNFCPYATHPDFPELAWPRQFEQAERELETLGEIARGMGLRLSFHPSQYVLLNTPRPDLVKRSLGELEWQSALLDRLGMEDECKVLLHVGGVYADRAAATARMLHVLESMPHDIRRRFALENDDISWSASEVLQICQTAEIPMILDFHHHDCLNSGQIWETMLAEAIATWKDGERPKTHLSTPRDPQATSRMKYRAHADTIDPQVAANIIRVCEQEQWDIDIMLEAKHKDLAVLRLREDLAALGLQPRPR